LFPKTTNYKPQLTGKKAAATMRLSTQHHCSEGRVMAMASLCYGSGVTETCGGAISDENLRGAMVAVQQQFPG